ncbi:Gx transporter family protein [Anaerobranca gottschalkii]|uniref:Heptaprenyl diphosphate synthase n=1 Tax=Anaerobranca gottschalkii DSM 13577 TaxID=1120990 RepID=A0A1H9YAL9_9FIRM|nr:Gx transporter family protein [Anaerobranca gottschalkii]SES65899.1 heptaprenyl diphosphate synthase [Anaerobranca gottschalkii DSM 13577]
MRRSNILKLVYKMVYIGILISMATVVHAVERLLPLLPSPVPGAKLGLANIFTLVTLNLFGFIEGFYVAVLRTFLAALITGNFGITFILSLSGAVLSTIIMGLMVKFLKKYISNMGISIVGAIFHNIGQLLAASLFLDSFFVFSYLPYLLLFAIPTGIFVGLCTNFILRVLNKNIQIN